MSATPTRKASEASRRSGAGAATASGTTFQEDVAAWVAVQILAEQATSPGFGLPGATTLDDLTAESFRPVDDLKVGTSTGGQLFLQCKKRIALSPAPNSELAGVVRQFVRQVVRGYEPTGSPRRPLAPGCDRLILATGGTTSATITRDLADALEAVGSATTLDLLIQFQAHRNQRQQRALCTLRSHFDCEWCSLTGSSATDQEWLEFVQIARVRRFDLSADGEDHRAADAFLRSQILSEPTNSAAAWAELISTVRAFAPNRTGGDRSYFRARLTAAGLALQSARSFRDDVEAVRRYSRTRFALLDRHSQIQVGDCAIKVARPVVRAIAEMARDDGVVVIGEPGAGKSGCLHDFVSTFFADGWTCVLLEAEHLNASSIVGLSRDLGIAEGRTLVDVLENWPTSPTGNGVDSSKYLVIDALDAARGQVSLATLSDLVRQVRLRAPAWRIVASIREFDLRHSQGFQELFHGQPHQQFQSRLFPRVRHAWVPRFSDEELQSAQEQFPELAAVLGRSSLALADLIKNPFNLRLLVELIVAEVPATELATVRVQVDLLDRYWERRVGPDTDGVVEHAVGELISVMKARRELTVDRAAISARLDGHHQELTRLQTLGLLRSEQRLRLHGAPVYLSFAHNILFDYAAARVWLKDLPQQVIAELEHLGQDLVLFARPSIVLAFQRLWHLPAPASLGREEFWERAITIAASSLRLNGVIIAAGVIASEFSQLNDVAYLLDRLDPQNPTSAAGSLLRHVVNAVRACSEEAHGAAAIIGTEASPWLGVAAEIGHRGLSRHAWQVRLLILAIEREKGPELTTDQSVWANSAARTLLAWSAAELHARPTEATAIAVACKTILVAPETTLSALERLLDRCRSEDWHELLRPLAEHFQLLAGLSSHFAARLITAAFTKEYDQEDRFNLGGRLLSFAMSKRDSMESVRRSIGKDLAALTNRRPRTATYLTLGLMRLVVAKEHATRGRDQQVIHMPFRGIQATIIPDYSAIWGSRSHNRHEAWLPALDGLQAMLERLGAAPETGDRLDQVLSVVAKHGRPAIVWNTLILAGAAAPAQLGVKVSDLLLSPEVLTGYDTEVAAGQLVNATWTHLSVKRREEIENAILSLPSYFRDGDKAERFREDRDRLLGCIPPGTATTAEANAAIAVLHDQGGAPKNQPAFSIGEFRSISEEEDLRSQGVDLNAPHTREVRELTKILQEAKPSGGKQCFTIDEVETLLSTISTMRVLLADATARDVHPDISDRAEGVVYQTLANLAKADGLTHAQPVYRQLRQLLLDASIDPCPEPPPGDEERKTEPFYGSGQPRIEAAEGLTWLARSLQKPDEEMVQALRRLACDPHWAVRFQVRAHINSLWDADRELMWEIIETTAREERDLRVLRFFVHTLVAALRAADPERIDTLVTQVQDRVRDVAGAESIANTLAFLATWRVVAHDHQQSRHRIAAWVSDPINSLPYLEPVIHQCRGLMVFNAVGNDIGRADRVRHWAFAVLRAVIDRVLEIYQDLQQANDNRPTGRWLQSDLETAAILHRIADDISNQVYFASGAFNLNVA